MEIAQAEATSEFAGLSASRSARNLREVDLNETRSIQNKRLHSRVNPHEDSSDKSADLDCHSVELMMFVIIFRNAVGSIGGDCVNLGISISNTSSSPSWSTDRNDNSFGGELPALNSFMWLFMLLTSVNGYSEVSVEIFMDMSKRGILPDQFSLASILRHAQH
ncbi:hypothetical protein IEQ34_011186 [Dendrobium chrysotoxum]|uniref:Pentatricopeptide repeat-containing protein n=1 Tax=Dendrobium chrysotoxum TaxID=161865 RepID=A0AAV7GXQ0_DENCH|nr:hypothetical protein IEQ34_011186 [Dendrobium chrysotoxum]